MGFYQDQVVPILTHLAGRQKNLAAYRGRVVPAIAAGIAHDRDIGAEGGITQSHFRPGYSERNLRRLLRSTEHETRCFIMCVPPYFSMR
jgi:hypothetical protein